MDQPPGRPAAAAAAGAATRSNNIADGRRLEMCPSLYRAARQGQTKEVMALLLQLRHGVGAGGAGHRQFAAQTVRPTRGDGGEEHRSSHRTEKGHGKLIQDQELYHRFIKGNGLLSRQNSALDTPLHCAARAGHADVVRILIHLAQDCGENILVCKNAAGDTALHLAARHGHGAAVEALVVAHATASELNKAGMSPLYLAMMNRSLPPARAHHMVHLLLKCKPELASQVDCNGSTPLHFAASEGNGSIVRAILHVVPPSTVYMKDSDGLSALPRLGHTNIVEKIIKEFPDAEELRDCNGETFLHVAIKEKRSAVVSLAIKNPMLRGLLNTQDGHGNTPLHLAVAVGAPGIVDALLRKGKVQTNVLNDDGLTPLDLASTSTSLFNMLSFVVTLVACGAQPRPQRHDHLQPWRGIDIAKRIEKMADSLAVVATLVASVAFAAGFNMPGSYGDDGMANLKGKLSFKWFLVLDTMAVAASVVAVILLVRGKVSHSTDSWKSFTIALNFMMVSLVSLVLAFYAAFRAVTPNSTDPFSISFIVVHLIHMGLLVLVLFVGKWTELSKTHTLLRFMWVWRRSHHAHAVKREYPFAGTSVYNYFFFFLITISFTIALNFMMVSLVSLVLDFYAAFCAVMTTSTEPFSIGHIVFNLIYIGFFVLISFVWKWTGLSMTRTVWRSTVLHVAAEQGHGELIRELYPRFISDKTILSRQNTALDTPLHCAARAGHHATVEILLSLSMEQGDQGILSRKNGAGDTALHLAARHGHDIAVKALVAAHGAEAAAFELNNAGVSPLYLAVMSTSVEAVRAITECCDDASCAGPRSQNALHAAVFQSSDMVCLLLQWRKELACQADDSGSTPLHFAASDGNLPVVKAIIRYAPLSTVYMKDSKGLSALHVAARMGHVDIVEEMTGAFPDVAELRDGGGETFLHAAAREKRQAVVSLAIHKSILSGLLDARDGHGNTPLHLAVVAGAPCVVEELLRKGKVRTDVLNNEGHTPLDLASKSTSLLTMLSLVVTLIAFKAQPRPQRQGDQPWRSIDNNEGWVEKTSDNLAVVAVLIATVTFAAGFNMPGGYGGNGMANLQNQGTFKWFMFLDTLAMAASVVAVVLLVYGKATAASSRSAESWKSFVTALHCMWVSLVSLIGAFYLALTAVTEVKSVFFGFLAVNACLWVLVFSIKSWVEVATSRTIWRFILRCCLRSEGEGRHRSHAIKRQFPYAGPCVFNLVLFKLVWWLSFTLRQKML
uniref:PGG domain-containing protein n=1 Tax=Leersia perrieri TaxID=77586 RepID=A0A0D9XPR3_9ORYZ